MFRAFSVDAAVRLIELARARKMSREVEAARGIYAWLFKHLRSIGPLPDEDEALYAILHEW